MRIKYYPERLAEREQHLLDSVLANALAVQAWCTVLRSWILRDDVRIILQ
jgi:hypothetical protein